MQSHVNLSHQRPARALLFGDTSETAGNPITKRFLSLLLAFSPISAWAETTTEEAVLAPVQQSSTYQLTDEQLALIQRSPLEHLTDDWTIPDIASLLPPESEDEPYAFGQKDTQQSKIYGPPAAESSPDFTYDEIYGSSDDASGRMDQFEARQRERQRRKYQAQQGKDLARGVLGGLGISEQLLDVVDNRIDDGGLCITKSCRWLFKPERERVGPHDKDTVFNLQFQTEF